MECATVGIAQNSHGNVEKLDGDVRVQEHWTAAPCL